MCLKKLLLYIAVEGRGVSNLVSKFFKTTAYSEPGVFVLGVESILVNSEMPSQQVYWLNNCTSVLVFQAWQLYWPLAPS